MYLTNVLAVCSRFQRKPLQLWKPAVLPAAASLIYISAQRQQMQCCYSCCPDIQGALLGERADYSTMGTADTVALTSCFLVPAFAFTAFRVGTRHI